MTVGRDDPGTPHIPPDVGGKFTARRVGAPYIYYTHVYIHHLCRIKPPNTLSDKKS